MPLRGSSWRRVANEEKPSEVSLNQLWRVGGHCRVPGSDLRGGKQGRVAGIIREQTSVRSRSVAESPIRRFLRSTVAMNASTCASRYPICPYVALYSSRRTMVGIASRLSRGSLARSVHARPFGMVVQRLLRGAIAYACAEGIHWCWCIQWYIH